MRGEAQGQRLDVQQNLLQVPAGTHADSKRMRNRLSSKCWELIGLENEGVRSFFVDAFHQETGARIPSTGFGYMVEDMFKEAELRDVLDAVTLMTYALDACKQKQRAQDWITFCARAFKEEGLPYRVDATVACTTLWT